MNRPKVGIVILNWNRWRDTVECLESVLRLAYDNYEVVVCDNGSTDDSIEKLQAWAEGRQALHFDGPSEVTKYVTPPMPKPIQLDFGAQTVGGSAVTVCDVSNVRIFLIKNQTNRGYAAGNNVGIRVLLERGADYVWVLNNDTVVTPTALSYLLCRMQNNPKVGICGSKLLYYWQPEIIQALGAATYNMWTTTSRHLALDMPRDTSYDIAQLEQKAAFVVGAAMLVTRSFIEMVGLLNEDYFLFFEEIDWAIRGARYGFTLAIAEHSIVYHKEGGSTGSNSSPREMSPLSDYYTNQSRLRFVRRYYPYMLPLLYARFAIALVNRLRRKQRERVPLLLKVIMNR